MSESAGAGEGDSEWDQQQGLQGTVELEGWSGRVETSYSWESGDPNQAFRVSSGQRAAGGWRKI